MALELVIVTPEREVFRGPIDSVVLPGTEGDFGVLQQHERFLSPLGIGETEVSHDGGSVYAALSGGFAEVGPDHVVVLVDACELAEDIDVARAERARARAERAIEAAKAGREDEAKLHLYEAALQRAVVRLQVSKQR